MRKDSDTTNAWPPIEVGTGVQTTEPNEAVLSDWTPEAIATRRWGVPGVIVDFHDSHGLSYEVEHTHDNSVGHYDPSELVVTK